MTRGKRSVIAVVLASAVALSVAESSPAATLGAVRLAEQVATAYWGGPTVQQCPSGVQLQIAPVGSLNRPEDPPSSAGNVVGRAQIGGCTYWLDETVLSADYAYVVACDIVLHEYGHLNGRDHTPSGIMSIERTVPASVCVESDPVLAARAQWWIRFRALVDLEQRCDRLAWANAVTTRKTGRRSYRSQRALYRWRRCRRKLAMLDAKLDDTIWHIKGNEYPEALLRRLGGTAEKPPASIRP